MSSLSRVFLTPATKAGYRRMSSWSKDKLPNWTHNYGTAARVVQHIDNFCVRVTLNYVYMTKTWSSNFCFLVVVSKMHSISFTCFLHVQWRHFHRDRSCSCLLQYIIFSKFSWFPKPKGGSPCTAGLRLQPHLGNEKKWTSDALKTNTRLKFYTPWCSIIYEFGSNKAERQTKK
jgi:hypothetical protein